MNRIAARIAKGLLAALLLALTAFSPRAQAQTAAETSVEGMRKARSFFEYGDYPSASKLLNHLIDATVFESGELRAEAYRLLGLADFYQGKKGEAYRAFLEMLFLNPDGELDPFYVPPAAVGFFEQVKKEAEPRLLPLRELRRAEEQERLKQSIEEARARQQHQIEDEQRKLMASAPTVERRVVQREFWVSLLPFGIGQLQNGDRALGISLATTEVIAGATSVGSALLIESLRDSATGRFSSSDYPLAQRLNVAKWIGAGIFYALWLGGAVHAAVRFQPEGPVDRPLLQPGMAPPAQAPLPAPTMPAGIDLTQPSATRKAAPSAVESVPAPASTSPAPSAPSGATSH